MNKTLQRSALKELSSKGFVETDKWIQVNEDQWICTNCNDVTAIYRPSTKMLRVPERVTHLRKRAKGWERW